MSLVQARINSIKSLQKLIATKEKGVARLQTELTARTRSLQDEITKGGTTGDPVRDLVIRAYGPNDELTAQYRLLQDKLKGKKGEFVLVRYRAEVRERFGGDSRSTDFRHEVNFRIGLLQGEELHIEYVGYSDRITLPVGRYLQGSWPFPMVYAVDVEERVVDKNIFYWGIDDQPELLQECMTGGRFVNDLLIGDEAVLAELKKVQDEKFFNSAAKMLGRLILEPTEP